MIDGQAFRWSLGAMLVRIINGSVEGMRIAVKSAELAAKSTRLFNDRSGYLRQHITSETSGLKGKVVAAAKYAVFVENGTKPHDITAKGGTLAFMQAGQMRFAKTVHHPGTAARPFMGEAKEVGQEILELAVNNALDSAIERSK